MASASLHRQKLLRPDRVGHGRALLAQRSRYQWVAAVAAICMPVAIITGFWLDSTRDHAPGAQIIYVKSWSANRSDAEIIADQKKAQAEKEALQKERQRQWQKLDDKLERIGI